MNNRTYANQISITTSPNETILHFAWLAPEYDDAGHPLESPKVVDQQDIFLTPGGLAALKDLIEKAPVHFEE